MVFAAMTFRLFRLTAQHAVNIFYWDQWDFNDATIFQDHSLWEIFHWQHGPHRQGLGGLLSALVEPWFQWNSRTEAFLAASLVVVAALCGLYLKYKLFNSLSWTDAIIPIIMLSPARWDMIWATVNLSHVILPTLIILYCLSWTCRNERVKFALIVILNFAIIYTGYGFFLGFLTPVLLFASYRADPNRAKPARIYLLFCIVAAVVSIGSFFVGYRYEPTDGCPSMFSAPPYRYVWFMNLMYATAFGVTGVGRVSEVIGGIVLTLVASVAWFSWKRVLANTGKPIALNFVLAVLSAFVLLFCVPTALARTCVGMDTAHASRYTNYMQLSMLTLYFCALTFRWPGLRVQLSTILLILLLPSLVVRRADERKMVLITNTKEAWRTCYLNGHTMAECNAWNGAIYPYPDRTRMQDKLDYLQATQQGLFSDAPELH